MVHYYETMAYHSSPALVVSYTTRERALCAHPERRSPRATSAQYTPDEYPAKVGWGHSTWLAGTELARAAGVRQLVLFHHDPNRTDAQLAALEAAARAALPGTVAAREGVTLCARDERAAAA